MRLFGGLFGIHPHDMDSALRKGLVGVFEDVGAFLYMERADKVGNIDDGSLGELLVDMAFYGSYKMVFEAKICSQGDDWHPSLLIFF